MRYISIVDSWFDDRPSGMARVAADHARAITRLGSATVACIGDSGTEHIDGVEVHRLPVPANARSLRRLLSFARLLERELAHTSWDVVHVHSPLLGAVARLVLGRGPSWLYTVHSPIQLEMETNWQGSDFRMRMRRRFLLPILGRIERGLIAKSTNHVLSKFTKDKLVRLHGPTDASVVPHWTKLPKDLPDKPTARSALQWPRDELLLLAVRGHKSRTGLDDLIRASAPLLREARFVLVIAGSGPLTGALKAMTRDLGVEDSVLFPGRLSEQQLSAAYAAADLLILPTKSLECFGLVTIEALAHGLPVIASDAGATPELLARIIPNALYPSGDIPRLTELLKDFLSGAIEMPKPAALQTFIEANYSEATIRPQFLQLVSTLNESRNGTATFGRGTT